MAFEGFISVEKVAEGCQFPCDGRVEIFGYFGHLGIKVANPLQFGGFKVGVLSQVACAFPNHVAVDTGALPFGDDAKD